MSTPDSADTERLNRWPVWTVITIGSLIVLLAAAVTVGADSMWLVALGDTVARDGHIPVGVPFAAADSSQWANLPVLGELTFALVHGAGEWGLPLAQLGIDAAVLFLVMMSCRRLGARDGATALVILVLCLGSLPSLGVVRGQLLSLVPFALLVLLLRAEHARPSWRVWLLAPLIALWGNLHGAVLVGVAVTACYLLASRLRQNPLVSSAVLALAVAALWLNPAGSRTGSYYAGVLTNEAARRGTGLWAPLDLSSPFDVLLVAAGLALVVLTVLSRPPMWEYLAVIGLISATATASRHGIWLLLFCAAPAAARLSRTRRALRRSASNSASASASASASDRAGTNSRRVICLVVSVAMWFGAGAVLVSRQAQLRVNAQDAVAISHIAAGRVVLAPEPIVESLAAAGVRVWLCNPIDAFSRTDQSAYLDFLDGRGAANSRALSAVGLVVVTPGSPSAQLAERDGFTRTGHVGLFDILTRP